MRTLTLMLLALVGCGGEDYCDRTAALAEECGTTLADADYDTCKDTLADCNADDEAIVDEWYDCLVDGGEYDCAMMNGTATADQQDAALDAGLTCSAKLAGLSEACLDSFVAAGST